ncbi:hypothetical protein AB5I41_31505 [Sphingomonas sp. MMS24-JH45]
MLKDAKQHRLEKPNGPIAYKGEAFRGSRYIINRYPALPANDLAVEGARLVCSDRCISLGRDSRNTIIRDVGGDRRG